VNPPPLRIDEDPSARRAPHSGHWSAGDQSGPMPVVGRDVSWRAYGRGGEHEDPRALRGPLGAPGRDRARRLEWARVGFASWDHAGRRSMTERSLRPTTERPLVLPVVKGSFSRRGISGGPSPTACKPIPRPRPSVFEVKVGFLFGRMATAPVHCLAIKFTSFRHWPGPCPRECQVKMDSN